MTLDDLVKVFHDRFAGSESARDAIRAVVEALRDHYTAPAKGCETVHTAMSRWEFNQILDSDVDGYTGGMNDLCVSPVKAAGGPTREDGPGGVEQAVPALTPAADVCEWTREAEDGAFNPSCDEWSRWTYADPMDDPRGEGYNFCPSCGKPIEFKETP